MNRKKLDIIDVKTYERYVRDCIFEKTTELCDSMPDSNDGTQLMHKYFGACELASFSYYRLGVLSKDEFENIKLNIFVSFESANPASFTN